MKEGRKAEQTLAALSYLHNEPRQRRDSSGLSRSNSTGCTGPGYGVNLHFSYRVTVCQIPSALGNSQVKSQFGRIKWNSIDSLDSFSRGTSGQFDRKLIVKRQTHKEQTNFEVARDFRSSSRFLKRHEVFEASDLFKAANFFY